MELYVLDRFLRRESVIDLFISLVWTERYSAFGDFTLTMHSTSENRNLLPHGTLLAFSESNRVMTVETVEDATDEENRKTLVFRGNSLESLLENRVARNSLAGTKNNEKWTIQGAPGDIARHIFDKTCRNNTLVPQDNIDYIQPATPPQVGTIPETDTEIVVELAVSTVYSALKDLCDIYDLGFGLARPDDTSKLYFDVYTGRDRTTAQYTLPPVIFSQGLDSLSNTKEYSSISGTKNVAYVYHANAMQIVYATGTDENVAGKDRRVLIVEVTDVDLAAGTELTETLKNRGLDELAKHRSVSAFDGEVPRVGSYQYNVDYFLGDLVEMRSSTGNTNNMLVTEQIFISDSEGERSYPTLVTNQFITPGSWAAWDYNQTWDLSEDVWETA